MAIKQINTVIVLRNDTKEAWEADDSYILESGEVGVGYMSVVNGDVTKKVPIVKIGDGNSAWKNLPQAEGVFEQDIILTSAFGRHTIGSAGYKNAGGAGMTTSEWLLDALSEVKAPVVTYPTASISASFTPSSGEAGTNITAFNWNGSSSKGSYQYGSNSNTAANSTTNVSFAWEVKNGETVVGTSEDKSGVAYTSQITDDEVSLTLSAKCTLTPAAEGTYIPLNNVGAQDADSKVKGFDAAGTTVKTFSPKASVTGYRKPFWGIKAAGAHLDVANITSAQVRALGNSGTATKGLPTTTEAEPFVVPAGSQQVFFLAKAGTYTSLDAKDAAAMNAGVTFTKVANAVKVEGANGYTAVDYDMFYVDWNAGIDAAKKLVLTWK